MTDFRIVIPLYIIGGAWSFPKTGVQPRFPEGGMLFGIML
jgi:hypothetical protein